MTSLGHRTMFLAILAMAVFPSLGLGDDLDLNKLFYESIPDSPFIGIVYRYVDTMMQHGRDTYGPQKTGMFLSILDRTTLRPLDIGPPLPTGVSEKTRAGVTGSNPQIHQNLLRLLYFLKDLSGEDRYTEAADSSLSWFLHNAPSPKTGLLPWGRHMSWDVMNDTYVCAADEPLHEFAGPWLLWSKCFQLAPHESQQLALALWKYHVVDQQTGRLSPRADFHGNALREAMNCPRQAGFFIRAWAEAYTHTGDEAFLNSIDAVLTRYEKKYVVQTPQTGSDPGVTCERLSMAIDCDGAARKVPEPLRSRLTTFAAREDATFETLPHELTARKGFVARLGPPTADDKVRYTSLWNPEFGRYTTAAVGVMCMSRYENTGRVGYRKLILGAADEYLDSLPSAGVDAWPLSFGQAITLELSAFRITAKPEYHARAFELGEIAVQKFFGDSPLPRASLKTEHYECMTGADTLVLALAELHLSTRTITAVRTPANTLGR